MKLAFCLFNYFPFGGLQRDFYNILKEALKRGHEVDVYTMKWEGEKESGFTVTEVPVSGWQNHSRARSFVKNFQQLVSKQAYDLIVGFNKMPGLDVYYAADTCYQAKANDAYTWWRKLTPRYRHYRQYEQAVFDRHTKTEVLSISPKQQIEFQHYYQTASERFHLLPPGISKDRMAPSNAAALRFEMRTKLGITTNQFLLLAVGSGFKTKGLDRSLKALASLPHDIKHQTQFFIIGKDRAKPFEALAKQLGIESQVHFLGGRHDVPHFLLAADLLIHPAYNENTGTVLLEALVSGCPVLTTDVCGYAHYIVAADAGRVLTSPFAQSALNHELGDMLISTHREKWQQNALNFSKTADIYSLSERALEYLEKIRKQRG